ncbi:hypothetical protein L3556_15985 [Candidatus Synechococcus calcipolaris G9]|uniref:Uncharacterized protein n=1 Tax=Candidatus Synechococcus calcipolaris G9 TaxID=1497997 RepID=A0ABT6F3L1_9SYNE|nr:hypothetical protein [Candidatus Synechococcus calcipolaris]MDG2992419.1 hypothetical protein [Candidatus Synechococcus calcipolaris G9]
MKPILSLRDNFFISLFVSTLSVGIALMYYLMTFRLNQPMTPIVLVMALSLLTIFLPSALVDLSHKKPILRPLLSNRNINLLIVTLLLSLIGLTGFSFNHVWSGLLLIIGVIFLFYQQIYCSIRIFKKNDILFLLIIGFIFSLFLSGSIWGHEFLSPPSPYYSQPDYEAFFHAAISSMMRTHGFSSTGLDGIPYVPYHYGSHWFIAQFANLVNTDSYTAYKIIFPVIFIPMLFHAFLHLLFEIRLIFRDREKKQQTFWKTWEFWLCFSLLMFGFFPTRLTGIWLAITFPPSLTFSILFLFITFSVFTQTKIFNRVTKSLIKKDLGSDDSISHDVPSELGFYSDYYFYLLPLLIFLCTLSKISTGALFFAVIVLMAYRLKTYISPSLIASLVISAIAFSISFKMAYASAAVGEYTTQFHFFGYLRVANHSLLHLWWFYLLFFWAFVYAFLRFRFAGVHHIKNVRAKFQSNQFLDLEILFLFCLLGVIPSIVFGFYDSYNFFDVQIWVSRVLLLSIIPETLYRSSALKNSPDLKSRK